MLIFDTICALSTPPYKSALAIVRLSGSKALDILLKLTKRKKESIIPNYAFYTKLYKNKEDVSSIIDECIVTFYKGPKSYTGNDSVDFFLHGNMIICNELLDTLVSLGARRADKGEFSAQAYFNDKFDLLKAQGINDLINASNTRAKNIALYTISGANTSFINEIKNNILSNISSLEYYIEDQYSNNDDESIDELKNVETNLDTLIKQIDTNINKTKKNNIIYNGINVAIVGETNVGKSTLLNAILNKDKAIVSNIPGTTRDIVEGEVELNGIKFIFNDTAGIRKTKNKIENLGIKKSYQAIKDANLVLLVSDNNFDVFKEKEISKLLKGKEVIKVLTKTDLKKKHSDDFDIEISALKKEINPLINLILEKLDLLNIETGFFLGKREEDYLIRIRNEINDAKETIKETNQIDISSDKLRIVVQTINEFLGNHESQTMEDIYQTLFSSFCLGK